METQQQSNETTIVPIVGRIVSEETLGLDLPENEDINAEGHPNFIESNTQAITLEDLSTKCTVPTFADNTLTISHQNYMASVCKAAIEVFGDLTPIECRVSHPIIGRIPSALHKKPSEVLDEEKTLFYQRLAWISHVKGLSRQVNGQTVFLTIGGTRAYNDDKLYGRQSAQKFKVFVAWSVKVCSNQMIQTSGSSGTIECLTEADIYQKAYQLFAAFDPEKEDNLRLLENLHTTRISQELFCSIVGRLRLYQALSTEQLKCLPSIEIGDQAVNAAVRGYAGDNPNFGIHEDGDGSISCWDLMNLLNEAIKATYIDRWVERNQACTDFAIGIQKAINGEDTEGYSWFLNAGM